MKPPLTLIIHKLFMIAIASSIPGQQGNKPGQRGKS